MILLRNLTKLKTIDVDRLNCIGIFVKKKISKCFKKEGFVLLELKVN
jgi:hypothetical protein